MDRDTKCSVAASKQSLPIADTQVETQLSTDDLFAPFSSL